MPAFKSVSSSELSKMSASERIAYYAAAREAARYLYGSVESKKTKFAKTPSKRKLKKGKDKDLIEEVETNDIEHEEIEEIVV